MIISFLHSSGDGPQASQEARRTPEGRRAPEGMPRQVAEGSRVPKQTEKPRDVLPAQRSLTDDEQIVQPPARWKVILKRIGIILLVTLALAMAYLFLLLGEPDNAAVDIPAVQEETIRVPMAAVEARGDADLTNMAATFGKPILVLYGNMLPLSKINLYDTAFEGGYARRATLSYAFEDGQILKVESIRPTAAAALLKGSGNTLRVDSLYAMAGMDAVRMEAGDALCILAQSDQAVYAITCPASHSADIAALLKQTTLWQPSLEGAQ